jgi:hypothetical protein
MSATVLCTGCGLQVPVPPDYTRPKLRCPECGVLCDVPQERRDVSPPVSTGGLTPRRSPETGAERRDVSPPVDDLLYGLSGQDERRCPVCSVILPPEAVLCVRCGLDLRSRQKVARTYQPIRRQWEPGLRAKVRWTLFLAFMALETAVVVWILLDEGDLYVTLFSWGLFTVLLAFLLGTFNRIDVERNKRGQARIRRTWHVCFVIRRSGIIPWHEYEGVVTGKTRLVGLEDWLVVLALLPLGLLPAILWWYYVIERDRYTVALARHHGFPEELLYCGYSPELCAELAETIRDATGLPLSRA